MSDSKITAGPVEWRQRYADSIEVMQTHLDGRQAQIHTTMPGIIVSYDAGKMTCVVQPALKAIRRRTDGTIEPVTIHTVSDVPVMFPGGGGHILTLPIAAGDDCIIHFAERSIDNWYQHGGTQEPSDYRMHDINDCFVTVGVRSQPHVLGGATGRSSGPAAHAGAAQLRSDDGNTVITLDGGGGSVTVKTGGVTIVNNTSGVTITAPTVTINGDLKVTGEVTAKSSAGGVTLSNHLDTGGDRPIMGT